MSSVFKFKKFNVLQEKSALKVGTDSMLLGSFIDVASAKSGLDLGAGTGVLSLMLAQKSKLLNIDAIEQDALSFDECHLNFQNSPWSNRLVTHLGSYFTFRFEKKYDLIFSNPPFYLEKEANTKTSNVIGKHTSLDEFQKFAFLVKNQLSLTGYFWIIVPYSVYKLINDVGIFNPLKINYLYKIHSKLNKLNSRMVIGFSHLEKEAIVKELVVRNEDNTYSDDYVKLTKDFHYNKL